MLETIMELKHILSALKRRSRLDFESIQSDSIKLLGLAPEHCEDTPMLFEETSSRKAPLTRLPNVLVKVRNRWRGLDWFNSLN